MPLAQFIVQGTALDLRSRRKALSFRPYADNQDLNVYSQDRLEVQI
jgi:hypothetical protein